MKRGVIISGNLAQDHEFIYPYYRLLEEGIKVDVCLLEGKPVKEYIGNFFATKQRSRSKKIEDLKTDDYDILILPGVVKSIEKVRQEKKIINFISKFNDQKKTIACICSGAQLLISAKVVNGRKIAGYYSMKDDLINAGADYTDKPAVIDKNIITTAHYKDMGPWMKEALKVLHRT